MQDQEELEDNYTDEEIRDQIRNFYQENVDKSAPKREKISILFVDDEEKNLRSFKSALRRDYKIHTAISAFEGEKILEAEQIHIIITDQRMPEKTGIEFLESIVDSYPGPIRILLTGYADIDAVIDAINKGQVYRYMSKPWREDEMKQVIDHAYEVYFLREKNKKLTEDLAKANRQLEFLFRQKLLDI